MPNHTEHDRPFPVLQGNFTPFQYSKGNVCLV